MIAYPGALNGQEREASPPAFPVPGETKLTTSHPRSLAQERDRSRLTCGEGDRGARQVLAIMYQFPPATEVGAQSCAQICRYLPVYGWDVTVLTVREGYIANADAQMRETFPGTVIRTRVIPHLFSIYRRLKAGFKSEPQAALSAAVERTESLPTPGVLQRWLLSILGLPDPYTGWIPPAVISGLGAVRRHGVTCLFSSGPWWTNHLVGLALAELTGLPWIAHFRDTWAQGRWVKAVSALSIQIEKALERQVLRKAAAVVCVTEQQTSLLRQANPELPPDKFITIPNGYDDAEWAEMLGDRTGAAPANKDQFIITYAGSLYNRRSPYPLILALRSLIDSSEIPREHVQLEMLGYCDVAEGSRVTDFAAMCGLADCVTSTGYLSRPETLRRVAQSDLLLLLVDDQSYSIPAKTYEYLRAGRPILALTRGGAVADLLSQTGGAWVVDPVDDAGIRAAVMEAYGCWRLGVAGPSQNQDVVAGFNRRLLAGQFAELFDRIAHVKQSPIRNHGRPFVP